MSVDNFTNNVIVPALVAGAIYSLVGLGFSVVERTTGVLNFAHGALIMWAPMAALIGYELWHWPASVAIGFAVLVTVGFALASERLVVRPYIGRARSLGWLLSGLGVTEILQQLAFKPFMGQNKTFPLALSGSSRSIMGIQYTLQYVTVIALLLLGCVGLKSFYLFTRTGRTLRAVGEDLEGAQVVGISPVKASTVAMVVSALLAVGAGFAAAPIDLVTPQLGFNLTFVGFVAIALGGLGSIAGAVLGGFVVGIVSQASTVYIGSSWSDTVLFSLLVVVYFVRPTGLLGAKALREV